MNIKIDNKAEKPAYIQLYEGLVKNIVDGVYPYGSKLPSKRTIAADTETSVITVEHAITLLNEEGYTRSKERSGVFVIFKDEDFISNQTKRKESTKIIKDKSNSEILNDTDFGKDMENEEKKGDFPISVLNKTIRKILLDYGDKLLIKSPNYGCVELKNEICFYLARSRGIHIQAKQVIIGSGAEYFYGLIAQFLGHQKYVALENPSYNKIRLVYESFGLVCDMLDLSDNGISSENLEKTKAKLLHVTPFNSYPSGITADISKKNEYLNWARKRDGIIIEDNFDSELTVSRKLEEPLFSMANDVNVIYINTFSRTIAPSMRIGYMILPRDLVEEFNKKLGFYSCTVPIFEQYLIMELLKNGEFERHINRVRRKKRNDIQNNNYKA